ncbi:MAG TPA: NAD(P)-binding domain-containing protein [Solirubrobacterales bacterium]|nr:NAD(P)-binding domain-containing protein [Solirubrobacterales bacterium]
MASTGKVCVIGAGSSGLTAGQVLGARGIPYDCFEKGSHIGGNWRYENDNGLSSAYRSLHINSSRELMSFKAMPMPDSYPDYPSHEHIARYFDAYAERFGLGERIRFNTEVVDVRPAREEWEVTVKGPDGERETQRYRAVLVANGHHWDPRWPEPPFPGADAFEGEQMHAHYYREPDVLVGKRVLVLGIGNSAVDIAVESSRIADATFLAMRRSAYVIPKYLGGKPVDDATPPIITRLPIGVQRFFTARLLKLAVGEMTDYGLPKPDHKLLEAHPTVSSELLPRIGHGDIAVKPNIERFGGGRTVRFVDGSEEEIDLVVYCTGYKISFPFFAPEVFEAKDNRMALYRRVVSVKRPGLYFIGFIQPLGPIMPIAEAQSEWIADLVDGKAALPSVAEMREEIAAEERRMRKRYVTSKRHTIQVDFHPYLREIRRERKQGAQRVAAASAERRPAVAA